MRTIPLFGVGVNSYSQVVTRQRRLNCIYDVRKDQDRAAIVVLGTPGTSVFITLPTQPVRGWRVIGTTLYVVAGTTLYSVTAGGAYTALTILPTVTREVSISDNSIQIIIVDGVAGYVYNIATATLTTVVDANFPNGATSVTFLNGRFIVNKPNTREFYVSQLLDGTNWTYLGSLAVYGTKENSSDLLLEVDVLNGTLVLWGQLSMEFWQDVGSSPLPYQRVNGATQTWGLAAINSHVNINNTEMFLGISPDGGIKVVQLNGYTPVPVSNSDIEYLISNLSTVSDATALVYSTYGHSIYQLTFPTANITLAYDTTTNIWHEAQTGLAATGRHLGNLGIAFNSRNYVSDATSGTIYLLDEDTYTDNGQVIPRELCTRHIRADGNEVFLSQLMLDFETGVGTVAGLNPTVVISISRDGGRTFGPEKQRTFGALGDYMRRVVFNRLGRGRDIVVKVRMTDAVKFVMAAGSAVVETSNG